MPIKLSIKKMHSDEERRILDSPADDVVPEMFAQDISYMCNYPAAVSTPTTPTAEQLPPPGAAENAASPSPSPPSCRKRFSILEPPVFLMFLSFFLTGAVLQNQVLYQTCVVVYHYNDSDCQPLLGVLPKTDEAKRIETEVQPYVAHILMMNSLISSIIPAILSLFIGPWSDKFGRRPVLLTNFTANLIGYVITTVLVAISAVTPLNPWVYTIAAVPSTLAGGVSAMMTMIFCYVSDVAVKQQKAKRMFLVDAAMGLGMLTGNLVSSFLLAATNAVTVFVISDILVTLSLIYLIVLVEESLKIEPPATESRVREFFHLKLVKELIHTCIKRRESFERAMVWIIMATLIITNFVLMGEGNIFYLFLRNKFNITLRDFTFFNSAVIGIKMIGGIVTLVVLRKIFKVPLTVVTMAALAGSVLESTVRATAQQWWEMYLGSALGFMSGISGPMLQAMLSFVVPATEIGKIYSLTTSLQTITPLGAAPLYTTVYNATLDSYPGLYNLISASLFLLCFVLISTIFTMQRIHGKPEFRAEVET